MSHPLILLCRSLAFRMATPPTALQRNTTLDDYKKIDLDVHTLGLRRDSASSVLTPRSYSAGANGIRAGSSAFSGPRRRLIESLSAGEAHSASSDLRDRGVGIATTTTPARSRSSSRSSLSNYGGSRSGLEGTTAADSRRRSRPSTGGSASSSCASSTGYVASKSITAKLGIGPGSISTADASF